MPIHFPYYEVSKVSLINSTHLTDFQYILYSKNYSPKARWLSVNIPWDEVEVNIHYHHWACIRRIIVLVYIYSLVCREVRKKGHGKLFNFFKVYNKDHLLFKLTTLHVIENVFAFYRLIFNMKIHRWKGSHE